MSASDTARTYYKSTNQELTEHIRLRDQALFLYLASAAVFFGIGLKNVDNLEILMVIPFIALGVSILVSQHDSHIGTLAAYLAKELDEFLIKQNEAAPQWNKSAALRMYRNRLLFARIWVHILLIIVPAIVGSIVNIKHGESLAFPMGVLWWLGILADIVSITIICLNYGYRRTIREWSET